MRGGWDVEAIKCGVVRFIKGELSEVFTVNIQNATEI